MKSDDLISRSKLIEDLLNVRKNEINTIPKLIRFIYEYPCELPIFLSKRDIKKILLKDSVKKIEVYPDDDGAPKVFCLERHGRWISKKSADWAGGSATFCSCCDYGYSWREFFEVENFNYCPNCGARMERNDGRFYRQTGGDRSHR